MSAAASPALPGADPFEHIGLLYSAPGEYAEGCEAFARRGLEAGDPVLVAVPGGNGSLIRERLGDRAAEVRFADMAVAGRNPGRIIPRVLLDFARRNAGRRVWIIGEPIWPGRSAVEYPACAAHEALINAAFSGREAAILCPYDTTGLDPDAVRDSHRTHPIMSDGTTSWESPHYTDPAEAAALFDRPLPPPPPGAHREGFASLGDLAALRATLARHARAAGLAPERVAEVLMAVNELAANAVEHTGAGGTLTVWAEPGALVCQIDDTGHIRDPLAGRVPPERSHERGHGLVLVNELADLVRRHDHAGGTTTRLYVTRP
ncbi:sensor histidine kinase [Microbispora sp. ATCC PTA-5024]|uniref:sensor histidine kinase n=1 Tax=Microbispora sp. ATCC PTA-5024 TaxID=316330 RepID=UPI0003DD7756|nr:sensor histidine kinase [Microbispora sp. ATCC PTA-5024]ETK37020.1 anti-sigma regulatory factor [Microbispora sp. ATCC PTA-5024]